MNHITRQRILGLIKEAVMYMPAQMDYRRPQTFAVINGLADFNKDNLGYRTEDIQNNDIWTRKASTINRMIVEFPVVAVRIASTSLKMENGWQGGIWTRKDGIQVYCLDKYVEEKIGGTAAARRSITQIIGDCEDVAHKIVEYLKGIRPYKVQVTPGQFIEDYFHPGLISWAQNNSRIVSSQNDEALPALSPYLSTYRRFLLNNQDIRTGLVEYPTAKDQIVGSSFVIEALSFGCDDGQWTWMAEGANISTSRGINFGR